MPLYRKPEETCASQGQVFLTDPQVISTEIFAFPFWKLGLHVSLVTVTNRLMLFYQLPFEISYEVSSNQLSK